MAEVGGEVNAKLSLDYAEFTRGMRDAGVSTDGLLGKLGGLGGAIQGVADGFATFGLAANGVKTAFGAVKGFLSGLVSGNAEFETFETQFSVLLGSTDAAQERLADLSKFAATTPFELPEVVKADKVLTAFGLDAADTAQRFGVSAQQIRTTIGDVAAGTGSSFEEIAGTFGRFASGATGDAIQRFQELGIATREQMASWGLEFSKSGELLTPAREAFSVLEEHVRGRFGGMMMAQSTTFEGMASNLSDWIGATERQLTAPLFEPIKNSLAGVLEYLGSDSVQNGLTGFATGLGAAVEEWSPRVVAAFEIIGEGVGWLANQFAGGFDGILSIVSSVGQAIYDALSWINPFATHSPALVDQVDDGVNEIVQSYRDLGDVSTPLDYAKEAVQDFAGSSKEAVQGMVDANRDALEGMKDALSSAKDELKQWTDTPIEGSKEFEDRLEAINIEIDKAQLRAANIKLARPAANDKKGQEAYKAAVQAANDEVERLRMQADQVKLEERVKLDPLRKQLKDLAKGSAQEMEQPFEVIKKGIQDAQGKVGKLDPAIKQMEAMVKAQEKVAASIKEAKSGAGGAAGGVASGVAAAQKTVTDVGKTVDDAKKRLDDWKRKVEEARAAIVKFFQPVGNAFDSIFGKEMFREQGDQLVSLGRQGGLVQQIQRAFEQGGMQGVGQTLYAKLAAEVGSVNWGGIWSNLQTKGNEIADWLGRQVQGVDWGAVWSTAKDVGGWIANAGWDIVSSVGTWLGRQLASVDWGAVWGAVTSVGQWLLDKGWDIGQAVVGWLGRQFAAIDWGAVWGAVQDVAFTGWQIVDKVAGWLGQQFASVDWADVWNNVVGFANGLYDRIGELAAPLTERLKTAWQNIDWNAVWGVAKAAIADTGAALAEGDVRNNERFIEESKRVDWTAVGDAWGAAYAKALKDGFARLKSGETTTGASDWFDRAWRAEWGKYVESTNAFTETVTGFVSAIDREFGVTKWLGGIGGWLKANISDPAAQWGRDAGKWAAEMCQAIADAIRDGFAQVGPSIDMGKWAEDHILGPLRSALDLGNKLIGGLGGQGASVPGLTRPLSKLPGANANGTNFWPGGLSWVGEQGPELVNLPRGAQVFPSGQSAQMAGASITVNITVNGGGDPRAIGSSARDGVLQAARALGLGVG